jgi:hypothetical protein
MLVEDLFLWRHRDSAMRKKEQGILLTTRLRELAELENTKKIPRTMAESPQPAAMRKT